MNQGGSNLKNVFILTGPPAAGKNTVALQIAHRLERCAVIDVDLVRWMIVQPHKAPWDGEEGRRQQIFGVHNTCLLTRRFLENDLTVFILDVLTHETAMLYKELLATSSLKIILLLPTFEEIIERNKARPRIAKDELSLLYTQNIQFTLYDEKIDNTHMSSERFVKWFLAKYSE